MGGRLLVTAALAFGVLPAQALATAGDAAATHSYVQADYALERASAANIPRAQAKIQRLNAALSRECPDAGAGSPQDEASGAMSYEVAVALWSVSYGVDAGPIDVFLQTVRTVHWSNRALTRAADAYATGLHELASLPLPGLCADVRAWRQDGYQAVPAGVASLVGRVERIEPKALSQRLLAPRGSDQVVLDRAKRLEAKVEESEFTLGQNDWYEVLSTLGLSQ